MGLRLDPNQMTDGFSTPNKKLREHNKKVLERAVNKDEEYLSLKSVVSRISKRLFKKDCDISKESDFPVNDDNFNWKQLKQKFMEADDASSFVQVLRAGVNNIANSAYLTMVGTTYEDWVKTVNSKKSTELYAPLQGIGFPRETPVQEKYPEVGAAGLDISLVNRKYGTLYAVTDELLEDDQTGQFQQQAGLLGEYMKLLIEALCYGKLASVAGMSYADFQIPTTETQPDSESVYPWAPATTPFVGGGFNRPATFGLLNQANVQAAKVGLMNQKNMLGLKMVADGNRLLVGPNSSFNAATLMNSSFYPTVVATGDTGGGFAQNPIKGLADISVSRFMFKNDGTVDGDSRAWYLVDQTKPWFVCQLRTGVQVIQEATNSGQSFERDITRFKVRQRLNADFIDPRFAWQGNDGSVVS